MPSRDDLELFRACHHLNVDGLRVSELREAGADPWTVGRNALAEGRQQPAFYGLLRTSPSYQCERALEGILDRLTARGDNVTERARELMVRPVLGVACRERCSPKIVGRLLELGADPWEVDEWGLLPLQAAAAVRGTALGTIRLLGRAMGQRVTTTVAAERYKGRQREWPQWAADHETPVEAIGEILQWGDWGLRDWRKSPGWKDAITGPLDEHAVQLWQQEKINWNARDQFGQNLLHHILEHPMRADERFQMPVAMFEWLSQVQGLDWEAGNRHGTTPRHTLIARVRRCKAGTLLAEQLRAVLGACDQAILTEHTPEGERTPRRRM